MLGPLAPDAAGPWRTSPPGRAARARGRRTDRPSAPARAGTTSRAASSAPRRRPDPEDWFDPDDGGLRCLARTPSPPAPSALARALVRPRGALPSSVKLGSEYEADADALAALADGAAAWVRTGWRCAPAASSSPAAPADGPRGPSAPRLEEAFRSYKRREAASSCACTRPSAAANARANALQPGDGRRRRALAGLAGASPAERLAALRGRSRRGSRLAVDEGERAAAVCAAHDGPADRDRPSARRIVGRLSRGRSSHRAPRARAVARRARRKRPRGRERPKTRRRAQVGAGAGVTDGARGAFLRRARSERAVVPGRPQPRTSANGSFSLDVAHAFVRPSRSGRGRRGCSCSKKASCWTRSWPPCRWLCPAQPRASPWRTPRRGSTSSVRRSRSRPLWRDGTHLIAKGASRLASPSSTAPPWTRRDPARLFTSGSLFGSARGCPRRTASSAASTCVPTWRRASGRAAPAFRRRPARRRGRAAAAAKDLGTRTLPGGFGQGRRRRLPTPAIALRAHGSGGSARRWTR